MNRAITVINNRIKERGVTLAFVSEQVHMNANLLEKTLNGSRNMKADELVNLCQALDLTLEDFAVLQPVAD